MRLRLALPALALALAGCISSNNSGSPGEDGGTFPTEDSGPLPGVDATVTDSSSPGTDSSVTDSAPPTEDAGVDATPPQVTMLVTNDLGPEPGVLVIFHDSTGAVIGSATTGANGMVSQQLAANSQVTAVFQSASGGLGMVTIQGVQPGDALTALDTVNLAFPASSTPLTIESLPDAGTFDAGSFSAYVGTVQAGFTTLPQTLSGLGFPASEVGGQCPLLVTVNALSTGTELAYSYAHGITLLTDGGTEVAVTNPWVSDESTPAVVIANPPTDDAGNVTITPRVAFSELAGDVGSPTTSNPAPQADGGWLSTFTGHPSYAQAIQTEATLDQDLSQFVYSAYQTVATRATLPDASAAGAIDLSQVLPAITSSYVDAVDAGTSARPAISWTTSGSLAAADGIVVLANFSLTLPDGGGGGGFAWIIVAPPTATSVTPPALPATLGVPAANTGQYVVPVVTAIEASFFASYAQLRAGVAGLTPTKNLLGDDGTPIAPTLPVDGTLRLSAVTQAGD